MDDQHKSDDDERKQSQRHFTPGTVGIANHSNMCFTSAVLQALSHCPPLASFFESMTVNFAEFYGDYYSPHDESRINAKLLMKHYILLQRCDVCTHFFFEFGFLKLAFQRVVEFQSSCRFDSTADNNAALQPHLRWHNTTRYA